jgi:hypothetical protein
MEIISGLYKERASRRGLGTCAIQELELGGAHGLELDMERNDKSL